uniref:Conserved hypothetical plastid protein n=1 Tax=Dictyopteris divaricata TaxID=156996 RepID=A0A2I4Q2R2_9PHAE|nr:conserved hypothetical plastid protein [Dictyopteris divaricata]YP_010205295.1 conserved hypothetical plastid protein [Grateloupia livida]AQZ25006.1 conserved hypothetical plastid protein [Dictyopteris divaricata]UAV85864.1 conserved hypothetical plastid protein [Grateloupia livida]
MCICLNCFRISNCVLYEIMGQKHKEVNSSISTSFYPQSPVIQTLLSYSNKNKVLIEWDINECLSYQEKPGSWVFIKLYKGIASDYLFYDLFFDTNY